MRSARRRQGAAVPGVAALADELRAEACCDAVTTRTISATEPDRSLSTCDPPRRVCRRRPEVSRPVECAA